MNHLYPIFLKTHELRLLIVGAGYVGHEKLFFLLKNSPQANVTLVAKEFSEEIKTLLQTAPDHRVTAIQKAFEPDDVAGHDLVIAATDYRALNERIREAAKMKGKLVNVADTPDLCDFYLGSVVTRGDLKIAISTNGKSPTFAKRLREWLELALPVQTHDLLQNLHLLRSQWKGDFTQKIHWLNELTEGLIRVDKG